MSEVGQKRRFELRKSDPERCAAVELIFRPLCTSTMARAMNSPIKAMGCVDLNQLPGLRAPQSPVLGKLIGRSMSCSAIFSLRSQ